MAKKARKKTRPRPVSATAARGALNSLTAEKRLSQGIRDGRLEIALSIASVTALVRVDTTVEPPETKPRDLFLKKFNDPAVGMSDGQMVIFKANLASLLRDIAEDVNSIPESAALLIEDVAEFIRLALLAA